MDPLRDPETFKRGRLSVQASSGHYCTPRQDGLYFGEYTAFEVGVLGENGLCRPSDMVGRLAKFFRTKRAREARSLDALFEEGGSPVAGWVSTADVDRLRRFLS